MSHFSAGGSLPQQTDRGKTQAAFGSTKSDNPTSSKELVRVPLKVNSSFMLKVNKRWALKPVCTPFNCAPSSLFISNA
jgi:hypothetical protein